MLEDNSHFIFYYFDVQQKFFELLQHHIFCIKLWAMSLYILFSFFFWFVFIKIYGRPHKQPWDNQALQTSGAFWIDNLWSITTLIFPRSKLTCIEKYHGYEFHPMWASMKNKNNIFQTSFPRPCKIFFSPKS